MATAFRRKRRARAAKPKLAKAMHPRVRYALALFDDGWRYSRVREAIMEKFKVSKSTAEEDIARGYEALADEVKAEAPAMLSRLTAQLAKAMAIAMEDRDVRGLVSAVQTLANLHGMEPTKKIEISGGSPEEKALMNALGLTPAQRNQREKELEDELKKLDNGENDDGE